MPSWGVRARSESSHTLFSHAQTPGPSGSSLYFSLVTHAQLVRDLHNCPSHLDLLASPHTHTLTHSRITHVAGAATVLSNRPHSNTVQAHTHTHDDGERLSPGICIRYMRIRARISQGFCTLLACRLCLPTHTHTNEKKIINL